MRAVAHVGDLYHEDNEKRAEAQYNRRLNDITGNLQQAAQQALQPGNPQQASEEEMARATEAIANAMGRGGGDFVWGQRKAAESYVREANLLQYPINDPNVQQHIQLLIGHEHSAQGTQMGQFKGDWRGGGFGE